MKELTLRQQAIWDFIQNHLNERGYWPSIREIQHNFQFKSTNAVVGHLRSLEQKGYISRTPGQARAFRLINQSRHQLPQKTSSLASIPIYGSIAAGYPDRVESSGAIGTLQMDLPNAGIRNNQHVFALKVRGESMINSGICDGDVVIVEWGQPENNDIVAALVDGETTLKRFVQEPGRSPYLKAENPAFPNIYPVVELEIQGIARSIIRCL